MLIIYTDNKNETTLTHYSFYHQLPDDDVTEESVALYSEEESEYVDVYLVIGA